MVVASPQPGSLVWLGVGEEGKENWRGGWAYNTSGARAMRAHHHRYYFYWHHYYDAAAFCPAPGG